MKTRSNRLIEKIGPYVMPALFAVLFAAIALLPLTLNM